MTDFLLQSQFELTLDGKNRLTIPARFRDPFRAGLYLVRSFDVPAVGIETKADYAEFVRASLAGRHPLDATTRNIERSLSSAASPADLDGQGRVTISGRLLEFASITGRDVMLVGSGRRFELWDPAAWEAYQPQLQEAMVQISGNIGGGAGAGGAAFPGPGGPGA